MESQDDTPTISNVPRRHSSSLMFDSCAEFTRFLKALLEYHSDDLLRMKTPEQLKTLVDQPQIASFKDLLMHKNFAFRWQTLHAKCSKLDPFAASSSMKTEAYDIANALEKTGSIVKHFSDFPLAPSKNRRDMQRYINELKTLQRMGKIRYNYNQRSYISHCVTVTKQKMAKLEEHERPRLGNDLDIVGHSMVHRRSNSETTSSSIGQSSSITSNGNNLLNSSNGDNLFNPSNGIDLLNTPNGHNVSTLQTNGSNPPPPAKRPYVAPIPQASQPSNQADNNSNQLRAIDFFIKANPEISMEEAFLQFSYLDTKQRSWFDNLEKTMSQQPAADSRFENPFIITQFLNFISFKCRQQLLEWKKPEQMAQEIPQLTGFEPFSELITDPLFSKKWNVLYEKCSNKEPPNMREAVNCISTYLNETGSAIKNFNYFPDPPKTAIQFYVTEKNMNDEPVLDMQFEGDEKYKQLEFEDLKRYYEELRTLQAAERKRHSRVQCLYLNNRISATKAKLQLQEAENGQGDQRISPLPNGQIENFTTVTTPSTVSSSFQPTPIMAKLGQNKLMAIDFFCILHPEMEKLEACKQFSCLSRDGRAIFDKLEEVQDVIYTRMTPMEKQRDQQNFSVGEKRSRVD